MKKLLPPKLLLLCLGGIFILHRLFPLKRIISTPFNWLGGLPLLIGVALTIGGDHKFSQVGTTIKTFDKPDRLVTEGMFRYSRNPIYLGFVLILFGVWIILGTLSPVVGALLFGVITNQWYIPYEEQMLTTQFGQAFEKYKKQTRRWF